MWITYTHCPPYYIICGSSNGQDLCRFSPTYQRSKPPDAVCRLRTRKKPGMFHVEWTVFPKQAMALGPFILESFPTVHGVPTLGFVLSAGGRKLAYFADTAPLIDSPPSAIGANVVIHEAGGVEAEESTLNVQGHCSGRQAALAAGKISMTDQDAPELFLCHLPPDRRKGRPFSPRLGSFTLVGP